MEIPRMNKLCKYPDTCTIMVNALFQSLQAKGFAIVAPDDGVLRGKLS
jgi:hypothetical protein